MEQIAYVVLRVHGCLLKSRQSLGYYYCASNPILAQYCALYVTSYNGLDEKLRQALSIVTAIFYAIPSDIFRFDTIPAS